MSFEQDYDELVASDKALFMKIGRTLLKQTFIVGDRNEESRKMYFFIRKNAALFSDYFSYIGFEIRVDQDNKVAMLTNDKADGLQSNRLRFKKYESIVLCALWTLYVDQVREGNLTRPIRITVFDLRQAMEKFGVKEEMEGKGILKESLALFTRYQLISVSGEIGSPDCTIRLYASLQFALDIPEFEKFVEMAKERMQEVKGSVELTDESEEDDVNAS